MTRQQREDLQLLAIMNALPLHMNKRGSIIHKTSMLLVVGHAGRRLPDYYAVGGHYFVVLSATAVYNGQFHL